MLSIVFLTWANFSSRRRVIDFRSKYEKKYLTNPSKKKILNICTANYALLPFMIRVRSSNPATYATKVKQMIEQKNHCGVQHGTITEFRFV